MQQSKSEVLGITGTDVTARLAKFFTTSYVTNMLKNEGKGNYLLLIKVCLISFLAFLSLSVITTPQPFYGPFSGTTQVSRCQKRTLDFVVQGKINRSRHTDHPAGCHSNRTNQCQASPSPHFFTGRMPFLPPNQQCQSTEGLAHSD